MNPVTKFSDLDLKKQYSYADYLTWQFAERVELIKGWIYQMSPAPSKAHQVASRVINGEMYNYFENTTCEFFAAPFDVRLLDKNKSTENKNVYSVVQPDVCVICDAEKLDDKGCIGAPDLMVEIISPGNSKHDLKTKFDLYEENKVQEYWVINPLEQNIMLYTFQENKFVLHKIYFDEDTIESILFSNLKIKVSKIFGIKD
jgi:Uma2 family endonuclease